MRTLKSCLPLTIALAAFICLTVNTHAQDAQLDPPHNAEFAAAGCLTCHDINAFDQPNMIPDIGWSPGNKDDTQYNNICWACHNGTDATLVSTHSSISTSTKYGDWSVGCSLCHNQHKQQNAGGNYVRNLIDLSKIDSDLYPKSGTRVVVFDGPTGLNSFADGVAPVQGICEVCHTETTHWRNDGTLANVGVHAGLGGTDCMGCHVHGDGFKADCTSCHGFPPGALVSNPGITGSATAGAHVEHYTNQNISCDSCHFENFTNNEHNNGGARSITIGFGTTNPIPQGGDYDGQAGVAYDATATTPATSVSGPTGAKTCSIIYCHGNYPGSGLIASPVWDNASTGDCGTCHGASNTIAATPASGSHNRHVEDGLPGGMKRNYECTLCHTGIVAGTGPASYTIADNTQHVNGYIEWAFDTTDSRLSADSEYNTAAGTVGPTDGVGPNRLYNTCNNVYCHSIVQTATGGALTADTADYKTPTWGGTVQCGDCHNQDGSHFVGATMDSGSHTEHLAYTFTTGINAMKCELCHSFGAPDITDNLDCSSCHVNGEPTDHVDGEVDINFWAGFVGNTGSYDGTAAPGDGYGTCASTYCHSEGTTTVPASFTTNSDPTWNVPFAGNCIDCHDNDLGSGSIMATGSHQAHLRYQETPADTEYDEFVCKQCHDVTVSDNRTISSTTNHVNKLVDIAFEAASVLPGGATATYTGVNAPMTKNPGSAFGDCSNTYCHSDGTSTTSPYPAPNKTPTWGTNFTDPSYPGLTDATCDGCHGSDYDWTNPITTNAHTGHIDNFTLSSTGTVRYRIGCSTCHYATGRNSELYSWGIANHANQIVNVKMKATGIWLDVLPATDAATFNGLNSHAANGAEIAPGTIGGACDNVYCHSIGNLDQNIDANANNYGEGNVVTSGGDDFRTVNWNNAAWDDTTPITSCDQCHGDQAGKAHPTYASGAAASTTANSHVAHVDGENAGGGKNCTFCHDTTDHTTIPPLYIADNWPERGQHINRLEDVAIKALAATTPDTYGNAGAKQCSNVYCHSDGTALSTGSLNGAQTVTWGGANMTCNSCHNTTDATNNLGPDYANGTPKANSHAEHEGYSCDDCHFTTTSDGVNVTNGLLHANGTYNLAPNGGAGVTFTYTYVAGGASTCSTVSCHGGTWTAQWGHEHDVSYNAAVDLSQVSMPGDNPCADCHTNNDDGTGTPLDSWTDILGEHLTDCATCHEYTVGTTPPAATVISTIATGTSVTCVTCHTPKLDPDPNSDHGGHSADFGSDANCTICHDLGTGWVVDIHNGNDCTYCHNGAYNAGTEKLGDSIPGKSPAGDARFADGAAAGGTWGTFTCTSCHGTLDSLGSPMYFHGITIATAQAVHNLSSDTSGGYDCEACHSSDIANEQLNTHMASDTVAQCTTVCHLNTTPSDASSIVAKTVIDNVTFNDPEPNLNDSKCENCHAQKGDFSLHGLSDDDSVADGINNANGPGGSTVVNHNNLSSATGQAVLYDGDGGTFTSKLNGFGGLSVSTYSCDDCHSGDRVNATSLEAMQAHTISGGGSGNCLTCHNGIAGFEAVIATGTGGAGTAVNCEDCHNATINGGGTTNSPSGKRMYQYDGVRHHTTDHAQAGDCTWCHADPRPATPTQSNGFGATATDASTVANRGVTNYDTGWVTDFSMTTTLFPKQVGCRLCHTNYETYSVNTQATVDDNTMGETVDLHGYHINNTANDSTAIGGFSNTGLVVYANDFNASTATSYPNGTNNINVRVPAGNRVEQTAMPSHYIPSASKIDVYDFGACLGCHSIQYWHAAPKPGADYPTPTTNANTMPYDTLRYAPGRSIFNVLPSRGFDGTIGSDDCGTSGGGRNTNSPWSWRDHCEPSEANNRWWQNERGEDVGKGPLNESPSYNQMFLSASAPNYNWYKEGLTGAGNGFTRAEQPVDSAVNNYEGLGGFPADGNDLTLFDTDNGLNHSGTGAGTNTGGIVSFVDITAPSVDDIVIEKAEWDGSTLTVWASSTNGDPSNLTFTTSNGSCTGEPIAMTWVSGNARHESTDCTDLTYVTGVSLTVTAATGETKTASIAYIPPAVANAVNDTYTVPPSATTPLAVMTNDSGPGIFLVSIDDTNLDNNCKVPTPPVINGNNIDITCGAGTGAMGTFDYVIEDSGTNQDTGTVTITSSANASPVITVTDPDGTADTVNQGDVYQIAYNVTDADSDPVSMTFYYDDDTNSGNGTLGTACTAGPLATPTGAVTCDWDTTGVTAGGAMYYIYGEADDGISTPGTDYSPGQVTVNDPPAAVTALDVWGTSTAGTSHTYTVPAGNARVIVVAVTTEGAAITGVSTTCATMNLVFSAVGGNSTTTMYYGLAGSSGSPTSCNVTVTGGAQQNISATSFANVKQAVGVASDGTVALYDAQQSADAGNSGNVTVTVNNPEGGFPVYAFNKNGGANPVVPSAGWTEDYSINGAGGNRSSWGRGTSQAAQPALVFSDTGTAENRGSMVAITLNPGT